MTATEKPFAEDNYELNFCTLRRMQPEDARSIAKTLVAMSPWSILGYQEETLAGYLVRVDPSSHRFVIMRSDKICGIVCVRYPWLVGAYLELIAVFSAFQGQGIGGEIIRWLENESFFYASNLWILVSSFNSSARKFYRRQGFQEICTLPDLVKPGYDEILLRKTKLR